MRRSRRTASELTERAKELSCLISVSRALADRRTSLAATFAQLVEEIPRGWQFPELAVVRLTWHDQVWTGPRYCVTPWSMTQVIRGRAGAIGAIEITYRERPVPEPMPPFIPEEARLLEAIAERVADVIDLAEAERQMRSLASQLVVTEERERRVFATYLHDRIGQELALLKLRLETVRGCARDAEPNRVIDEMCELAGDLLGKTRTLTFEISPPILHELGLVPALEWLADQTRSRHGLPVEVDADPVARVDDDLGALVFRSTSELIANVIRHAHARSATIRVRATDGALRVEVADDGRGFEPERADATGGFGLFSIRERLAYVGGRLAVRSAAGEGADVVIEVPLAWEARS